MAAVAQRRCKCHFGQQQGIPGLNIASTPECRVTSATLKRYSSVTIDILERVQPPVTGGINSIDPHGGMPSHVVAICRTRASGDSRFRFPIASASMKRAGPVRATSSWTRSTPDVVNHDPLPRYAVLKRD